MARSDNGRRSYRGRRRVAYAQRYSRSRMHPAPSPLSLRLSPLRLLPVGDGRFFYPSIKMHRPIVAAPRAAARLVVGSTMDKVRFASPRGVLLCLRRKMRREVLMAAGMGGKRVRRPKFNANSQIGC